MRKHIASILFLSLLSIFQLMPQSHSVKRLGIEQGLSNNYVISIAQDKQGFLWFATEEGLNKFDGTRFITYYKNDLSQNSQGITGNELNRIYADAKRPVIWIATQRDGLNAYDYNKQTFTAYLNTIRMNHACQLLLETDDTVLEIALECGYENVSYFIRLFGNLMHCTPLQYRLSKQHRLKQQF